MSLSAARPTCGTEEATNVARSPVLVGAGALIIPLLLSAVLNLLKRRGAAAGQ